MNSLADSSSTAYNAVKRAKKNLKKVREKWAEKIKEAEVEVKAAEEKVKEVEERTNMSEETLAVTVQSALDAAQRAIESAQRRLESVQQQAENDRRTDTASAQQAEIERLGYVSQRREKQETLDILRATQEAGDRITAPIGGTVKKIRTETGVTQAGEQAAVLSRGDLGYQFTGTLDQKEAEHLAVGDEGALSFTSQGKSQSAKVTITSISRADDKGQVPVTVKAKDSERVAVEADGLLPEDQVVVNSSKPIDQGDRVRVLDETA